MNRHFMTPMFRVGNELRHNYAMMLGRIEASRANELLDALLAFDKVAETHHRLSSMRFSESENSMSLVIYPFRGPLHELYSLRSGGREVVWLPAGFNPLMLPNPAVPITITSVLFRVPSTNKKLLLFEATTIGDKYHTTELPIDLLESAAGVRLIPAFPGPPISTKDS